MTKQPPYVTKLRLSKLCRGIIALAVVKLCLLGAIVADIPLPELRWEKVNAAQNTTADSDAGQNSAATPASPAPVASVASVAESTSAAGKNHSTTLVMGNPGRSLLAASATSPNTSESTGTAPVYTTGNKATAGNAGSFAPVTAATSAPTSQASPAATVQADPQGAAAAAAAARMRPLGLPGSQNQPADTTSSPVPPSQESPSFAAMAAASGPTANNAYGAGSASPQNTPVQPAQRDQTAGSSITLPVSSLTRENAEDLPSAQKPASLPSKAAASPAPALVAPNNSPLTTGPALLLASDTTKAPAPSTPTAAGDNPWWKNMLQITHLPVPSMGVAQVAHAAALDTPPAPAMQGNTGGSPFTPPAQQVIPKGQDSSGAPLPPRSTTARPAGTPQLPRPAGADNADPMTSAVPPPVPNVGAYSPPEDPNRKQQELARREQEILALKQQMEQRLEELRTAEMRVKGMLKDAQDVESQKVSGLIAVYANMKPKQAAQTLQSLDERVAVKILTGLTPKQAGEILSYADPKITAKLTELMTRMHMQP